MSKANSASVQNPRTAIELEIKLGGQNDRLSKRTIEIYTDQLMRLFKQAKSEHQWDINEFLDQIRYPRRYDNSEFEEVYKVKISPIIALLFNKYSNKETRINALSALVKVVKHRYNPAAEYYNAIRSEVSKQNKAAQLDNEIRPEDADKYISYSELMSVPDKAKDSIIKAYGTLFISKDRLDKMKKTERIDYLRSLFDYITLYLNVNFPLRLVWPTVFLMPVEGKNYLQGNKLHLNDFKNVRMMGPRVRVLDKKTMKLLDDYLAFIRLNIDANPTKLLWRVYNNAAGQYDYTNTANGGFSQVLSRLFVKYNKKPMSMNMIRHIVESHLIQSPEYARMTNRQKHDLHADLLHSAQAANLSYNKIMRAPPTTEEANVEFNDGSTYEPEPPTVIDTSTTRNRRKRIFQGKIDQGNDKQLEIELFETLK